LREVTEKYKYKLRLKGINEEHSLKEGERKEDILEKRRDQNERNNGIGKKSIK
jgi:hypothetical protein